MFRRNKYYNHKTTVDNIKFDSTKEATYYLMYKQQEKEGKIKDLKLQPRFELQPSFKFMGKTIRKIEYVADFSYYEDNKLYVIDVKGYKTEVYKLKKKLLLYKYPDINFKEV